MATGTATPQPNPERDRFNAIAANIGPDRDCDVCTEIEDRDHPAKARFAILMLGTDSLDALNLVCLQHADPASIDEYYDAGDTFAFILLPRF